MSYQQWRRLGYVYNDVRRASLQTSKQHWVRRVTNTTQYNRTDDGGRWWVYEHLGVQILHNGHNRHDKPHLGAHAPLESNLALPRTGQPLPLTGASRLCNIRSDELYIGDRQTIFDVCSIDVYELRND